MTEAWNTVLEHPALARRIAQAAQREWGVPYDDGLQAARLGLYRAALEHDPERGPYGWLAWKRSKDELRRLGAYPRRYRAHPLSLDSVEGDGRRMLDGLVGSLPRPDATVVLSGDLAPVPPYAEARPADRLAGLLEQLTERADWVPFEALAGWAGAAFGVSPVVVGADLCRLGRRRRVERRRAIVTWGWEYRAVVVP